MGRHQSASSCSSLVREGTVRGQMPLQARSRAAPGHQGSQHLDRRLASLQTERRVCCLSLPVDGTLLQRHRKPNQKPRRRKSITHEPHHPATGTITLRCIYHRALNERRL